MGRLGDQAIIDIITQAAQAQGVPVQIALAQAQHESGMNANATHQEVNGCVAIGLFQLEDCYFAQNGDLTDPTLNANVALAYLAQQYAKYGNWTDALDAYNEGPTAFDQGRRAGSGYAAAILAAAGIQSGGGTTTTAPPPAVPVITQAPMPPTTDMGQTGSPDLGAIALIAVAGIVAVNLFS